MCLKEKGGRMTQAEFETIRHSFDVYGYLGHDQTEELIAEITRLHALVEEAYKTGYCEPNGMWSDSAAQSMWEQSTPKRKLDS